MFPFSYLAIPPEELDERSAIARDNANLLSFTLYDRNLGKLAYAINVFNLSTFMIRAHSHAFFPALLIGAVAAGGGLPLLALPLWGFCAYQVARAGCAGYNVSRILNASVLDVLEEERVEEARTARDRGENS